MHGYLVTYTEEKLRHFQEAEGKHVSLFTGSSRIRSFGRRSFHALLLLCALAIRRF